MSDIPNPVKRGNGAASPSTRADRRKAYERIAAGLRDQILSGELARDERLPVESELARTFGVSRPTVREALRLLTAQNLVVTAKGRTGGSYVSAPSPAHISEYIRSGLDLLADGRRVSLEELLETRELLEVPAARLAALRRNEQQLTELESTVPAQILKLSPSEQFAFNEQFHSVVIQAAGNTLLAIAAAVAAGDADAAEGEMRSHLRFLHPFYERAWRAVGAR